jgi:hypothetical protein
MNHWGRTYRAVVVFDCLALYWNFSTKDEEYYEVPQSEQPFFIQPWTWKFEKTSGLTTGLWGRVRWLRIVKNCFAGISAALEEFCLTWRDTVKLLPPTELTWLWEFFFSVASTRLHVMAYPYGASQSHSLDTPHWVGLLWVSDQPDAESSLPDNTRHSQQTNIHAPGGIRTHNLSSRAAAVPCLRPRGHWNRRVRRYSLIWIHNRSLKSALTEFVSSLTNTWRYTTLVRGKTLTVSATKAYSWTRHYMGLSGQLHAPASVSSWKNPSTYLGTKVGGAPQLLWTFWRRKISPAP